MKILRAAQLGMCFGVRDALALAREHGRAAPLTVLGDLVHNELVQAELRRAGVRVAAEPEHVATQTVMITAHGASERRLAAVRARGLNVVEATCPLVRHAHQELKRLVADGFHPVVIGQRGHAEVRGLTEDFAEPDIVLTAGDVAALRPRARFGVVAQTTQPIQRVRELVARIQARFPEAEVRFADTVCQPTRQRQTAAVELARQCDVVVVIGGAHSNNTRELVATCRRHCPRVHHVQTAADLVPEWFTDAETVGLTAGTSTPDEVVDGVERRIKTIGIPGFSQPNSQAAWTQTEGAQ